jgi:hypothetical protein
MRFELTTLTLARLCSTPELRPHSVEAVFSRPAQGAQGEKFIAARETVLRNAQAQNEKGRPKAALFHPDGAGDEIRTHDPNLGKVMLYP